MYSTVSKNYETSFDIVTRSGLTALDFDRCTVKGSSCVGERMRTSLNQLLNQFYHSQGIPGQNQSQKSVEYSIASYRLNSAEFSRRHMASPSIFPPQLIEAFTAFSYFQKNILFTASSCFPAMMCDARRFALFPAMMCRVLFPASVSRNSTPRRYAAFVPTFHVSRQEFAGTKQLPDQKFFCSQSKVWLSMFWAKQPALTRATIQQ